MTLRLTKLEMTEFELSETQLPDLGMKTPTPRRFPWMVTIIAILLIGLALFPWSWRKWVEWRYKPVTYSAEEYQAAFTAVDAQQAAPRVAIVFGARVYSQERLSAMLRDRVDTAVDLYFAGQVEKLLLTGGQNGLEYDEPAAMVAHAFERGVPVEDIQPDYGGRRTYDSCYRATHIFQVERAVLVTQEFHLPPRPPALRQFGHRRSRRQSGSPPLRSALHRLLRNT